MLNENKKSIVIYFIIIFLNILLNIPIFMYLTWYYICDVGNYLIKNLPFLNAQKPVVLATLRPFAIVLMLNILQILVIEFIFVCLFHERLNAFFRIKRLFTKKKAVLLSFIIVTIQFFISYWLW